MRILLRLLLLTLAAFLGSLFASPEAEAVSWKTAPGDEVRQHGDGTPEAWPQAEERWVPAGKCGEQFFLGTVEDAGENGPSAREQCRINGWLNYDTTSGCSVSANNTVVPCFIAGTLVATPDGDVEIQDIEEGDIVHAFDFNTGEIVEQRVLKTYKSFTYYWVNIDIGDGEVITATRRHRFWVESENDWLAAIDLRNGMTVLNRNGEVSEVLSVTLRELENPEDTFNLEVENDHNYFVGISGTLVHNGYPESPRYPPATEVGENFQFNFDDSPDLSVCT